MADGNPDVPVTQAVLFKNNLFVREYDTCNEANAFANCSASCVDLPEALSRPSEQVAKKSL